MDVIEKQPAEKFAVSLDFTNRLPTGLTISSGTVTAKEIPNGAANTNVYVTGTLSTTNTTAAATVQAGEDGKIYQLTYTVTLSDTTTVLAEDFLLKVRKPKP